MLGLGLPAGPMPKCYFAESALPTYIDHAQPPTKKRPFATVLAQTFNHTLSVVLPQHAAHNLQCQLANSAGTLHYARVHMKPIDLIRGDFFNHYIKAGNVVMLSEGQRGIDQIISLSDGNLRLEVNKPTYERMGLQGTVIPSEGRKHVKARYAIEINLRLPSMVHGKRAFERVVWAFKNVFDTSLTWLFCDLKSPTDGSGPLGSHHPVLRAIDPHVEQLTKTITPKFTENIPQEESSDPVELLEWLSLLFNSSPRVKHDDNADPYMCRYCPPGSFKDGSGESESGVQDLVKLQWHGLITPTFASKILLAALKSAGGDWFAMTAVAFNGQTYTVLKFHDRTLTWETVD